MAAPVTLRCTACGYENESQRVYCHNCGTKLDRRLLPRELQSGPDNAKVEQHIKKITDPRRGLMKKRVTNVLKSLGIGAGLGLLLTVFRLPEDSPEVLTADQAANAPFIYDDLQNATNQGQSRRFVYTQQQCNGYLQSYRPRETVVPWVRFERTFVIFEEGAVEVTAQMSAFTYPINFSSRHQVTLRDGRIDNKVIGGRIGRLSIPGPLMSLCVPAFEPLWKLIDRDRKNVAKLQAITFRQTVIKAADGNERREGVVEMVTKSGP